MRARRKTTLGEVEMNLTPLIDICFTILIMFIVVAPLLEMERVELANGPPLTQDNAMSVSEKSSVTLHVYSDDTIALNQQRMTLAQLKESLSVLKQKNPAARPQLFHDHNAKFGTYQSVKNALESAGFTEMDLILKPE